MAIFGRLAVRASLRGTRDQPRRMNALGYHVWMVRFLAFLFSGFWSGVGGASLSLLQRVREPPAVALTASAEALLMVISGARRRCSDRSSRRTGRDRQDVRAPTSSAGTSSSAPSSSSCVFMPEGLVPGTQRLWRWARAAASGRGQRGVVTRSILAGRDNPRERRHEPTAAAAAPTASLRLRHSDHEANSSSSRTFSGCRWWRPGASGSSTPRFSGTSHIATTFFGLRRSALRSFSSPTRDVRAKQAVYPRSAASSTSAQGGTERPTTRSTSTRGAASRAGRPITGTVSRST